MSEGANPATQWGRFVFQVAGLDSFFFFRGRITNFSKCSLAAKTPDHKDRFFFSVAYLKPVSSNETTNLPVSQLDFCANELSRSWNVLNDWRASEVLKGHLDA